MKNISFPIFILTSFFITVLLSCSSGGSSKKELAKNTVLNAENETEALFDFFEKSGSYINSPQIPALVFADDVFENIREYKLIDIRNTIEYLSGHIESAENIKPKDIINYMKFGISAVSFEKIVIISNSGFDASYVTSVLRLLGYNNVFALKYGMSSWNKEFANEYWNNNLSSKYVSTLETAKNEIPEKNNYPTITTGKTTAYEILEVRARQLLDSLNFRITADSLYSNISKYFIVNYWPNFQYEKGHIPGSFQYTPRKSLTKDSLLLTLPVNKPIVLYEYTGHHSSFAAAYLQILGYDSYVLDYGTNAIMYSQLASKKIGRIFNMKSVNNYSVVTGQKKRRRSGF
ncbi:MAG: rhodanese-like domain-containing protein [Bacteroidales bacterium]|nr:rhodanese-like domain-containing protein [Bacteroidales bacterium]